MGHVHKLNLDLLYSKVEFVNNVLMVVVNVNRNLYRNVMINVFKEIINQAKINVHHVLNYVEHVNPKKIVQNVSQDTILYKAYVKKCAMTLIVSIVQHLLINVNNASQDTKSTNKNAFKIWNVIILSNNKMVMKQDHVKYVLKDTFYKMESVNNVKYLIQIVLDVQLTHQPIVLNVQKNIIFKWECVINVAKIAKLVEIKTIVICVQLDIICSKKKNNIQAYA